MTKNKITYIISDIDKSVFFEHTATLLRNQGFDLSFILINSANTVFDQYLSKNGFHVRHLTIPSISKSIPSIFKCKKLLKEINPEIIHCHLGIAYFVGLLAGFLAGIKKRVYTKHGGLSLQLTWQEKLLDFFNNRLAGKIIATTVNIKDILLAQKVPTSKISLIHYGFDLQRMMQPDEKEVERIRNTYNKEKKYPVIGVIARWVEWKGIQYIIPAFEKLLSQYPNAQLCLFNANEHLGYAKTIKAQLSRLPSNSYITVPFEYNVYDLYQLFDVYVHTPVNNTCEAFGQTYVEALAAGIPSVFTPSGVAGEFIHDGENALVVDFKSSDAIYDGMLQLIDNKDKRHALAKAGSQAVSDHFSLEMYINKLKNFYQAYGYKK